MTQAPLGMRWPGITPRTLERRMIGQEWRRESTANNGSCRLSEEHGNMFGFTRQGSWTLRKRRDLLTASIGFDLPGAPPSKAVERQAEELYRSAASLLLFQSTLKGRPAQAFLKACSKPLSHHQLGRS
jgi:hypothetical protein